MENVLLVVHLIIALVLIGAVLLQRSEGGALGIGGGGAVMSGRGAATALQKVTWGLATAFFATSLSLAVLAAQDARAIPDGAPPPPAAPVYDDGGAGVPALPALPSLPSE
ncbi:MAG: preprotein translocase subunit SecG [Pseudomonadota bacterium]